MNLPVLVLFPRGWSEFFRLNARRGDDMDSLYNVVKSFTGWSGFDGNLGFWEPPVVLNTVVAVLFLIACAGIAYVALTAPRRPRVAQLAFLVVAAFLLTNKVWSPQFSLWLVPLAVLALPHRRILLAWMTIDALVWVPRMYYLYGDANHGSARAALHRDGAAEGPGGAWRCARWWSGRSTTPIATSSGSAAASTTRPAGSTRTVLTRRPLGYRRGCVRAPPHPNRRKSAISLLSCSSGSLVRLPTQATLLPRIRRGRTRP